MAADTKMLMQPIEGICGLLTIVPYMVSFDAGDKASSMDEPLQKYVVLVPLRYNDGTDVPKEVIVEFQEKLYLLGGGFTIAGTVEGAYRMADGKQQIDHSLQYWIGVAEGQVEELRAIVSELGDTLGQESMYLEHTASRIEFVPPKYRGGKKE